MIPYRSIGFNAQISAIAGNLPCDGLSALLKTQNRNKRKVGQNAAGNRNARIQRKQAENRKGLRHNRGGEELS